MEQNTYTDSDKLAVLKQLVQKLMNDDGPLNHLHVQQMYQSYERQCGDFDRDMRGIA